MSTLNSFSFFAEALRATVEGSLSLMAAPGQKIKLYGAVSDPDEDEVSSRWWQFYVGSYPGQVEITQPNSLQTEVLIPEDAEAGQNIHIILEATDTGKPELTRYQRVIIKIRKE